MFPVFDLSTTWLLALARAATTLGEDPGLLPGLPGFQRNDGQSLQLWIRHEWCQTPAQRYLLGEAARELGQLTGRLVALEFESHYTYHHRRR